MPRTNPRKRKADDATDNTAKKEVAPKRPSFLKPMPTNYGYQRMTVAMPFCIIDTRNPKTYGHCLDQLLSPDELSEALRINDVAKAKELMDAGADPLKLMWTGHRDGMCTNALFQAAALKLNDMVAVFVNHPRMAGRIHWDSLLRFMMLYGNLEAFKATLKVVPKGESLPGVFDGLRGSMNIEWLVAPYQAGFTGNLVARDLACYAGFDIFWRTDRDQAEELWKVFQVLVALAPPNFDIAATIETVGGQFNIMNVVNSNNGPRQTDIKMLVNEFYTDRDACQARLREELKAVLQQ